MRSFFKIFFACLLALVVFLFIGFLMVAGVAGSFAAREKPVVSEKSVLQLNLGDHFREQKESDPLQQVTGGGSDVPGLYDAVRLIRHAKTDDNISGIYIQADGNANGLASSQELRQALLDFKTSGKFVLAYGDMMRQGAYFVASAADKVYINPAGDMDWKGFSVELAFFKGMLDKLEIQPQVFYAGKFKSATEPFRTDKMTPENKLQTTVWLSNLYQHFLQQTAAVRKVDTATLRQLAETGAVQTPQDALRYRLVDGLKYDDEVKDELKKRLGLDKKDKINLLSIGKYEEAADYKATGKDRIAVIYAEGNIVDGEGSQDNIGGDRFRKLIRKVRLDESVKAIVLRVNSGGGSALASENIWRELAQAKKEKPVVVSFGDVAASGGYYIACGADSIFASPNTITGSIGVFSLIPNMEGFFRSKAGVTFDGVKTAQYADAGAVYRPLSEAEKSFMQQGVDRIYLQFKQRVAQGRKKDIAYIDSIAQGRVWNGTDALRIGLVDRVGGLQEAVNCAARLAKADSYRLREYPESPNFLQRLLHKGGSSEPEAQLRQQVGEENYKVFRELVNIRQICGSVQARLPFEYFIK
ncbi:signal peptide peptidase SppA [Paraflavisolibacter sp. H34]|uniref:signal peptide peptidase SppA n=1 Tax=Huijunlia imazamoxiresistens TaxID=3127457 RepID=UPI0030191A6E